MRALALLLAALAAGCGTGEGSAASSVVAGFYPLAWAAERVEGDELDVANLTPPGQPCYCLTSTGARVDGYVIAYRFSDVPSVVK